MAIMAAAFYIHARTLDCEAMKIVTFGEWREWVPRFLRKGLMQLWPLSLIFMRERKMLYKTLAEWEREMNKRGD